MQTFFLIIIGLLVTLWLIGCFSDYRRFIESKDSYYVTAFAVLWLFMSACVYAVILAWHIPLVVVILGLLIIAVIAAIIFLAFEYVAFWKDRTVLTKERKLP